MPNGYVAFLDVLGFSKLVEDDHNNQFIESHWQKIEAVIASAAPIKYVIFSDSLVLTVADDDPEALLKMIRACSRLMGSFLEVDVPVRGAIAHGSFVQHEREGSVFVAGKALIDAYNYEQRQDWVGVMLTPSVLKHADVSTDLVKLGRENGRYFNNSDEQVQWASMLMQYNLPFKASSQWSDSEGFLAYAIIPHGRDIQSISATRETLEQIMAKVQWLKSLAPSPAEQRKYDRTYGFLGLALQQLGWLQVRDQQLSNSQLQ